MRYDGFYFIFAFLTFFSPLWLFPQTTETSESMTKLLMDSDTRTIYKLNGYWETSIENGDFSSEFFPKIFYNCSKIKLRKIIRLDKQLIPNSVWHLYFLGVNDEIEIYWNNQFLGKFISDGSPLWITLPRKITIKENNEVELVISPVSSLAYQTRKNYLYYRKIVTGIPRDFMLVRTPLVWINNYILSQEFENLGKANLKTKVTISSFEVENLLKLSANQVNFNRVPFALDVILRNKETKQIVGQASTINFEMASFRNASFEPTLGVINPILWEPEKPYLYELELKVSFAGNTLDVIRQEIGFTKWDTYNLKEGIGWLLNGKPFTLKAVDFVEDFEYYSSRNVTTKYENDLKNLKSLGANAVRFLFNPPNPLFVSLANRYGILVLIDLPVYYVPSSMIKKSDLFVRFQTISENVLKNFNSYPALFAIGLAEGTDFSAPEVIDYLTRLSTRLNNFPLVKKYIVFVPNQISLNVPNIDFFVIKDYFKSKEPDDIISILKNYNSSLKKPLIFNFGTIIDPNNHNGYNDILSVDYQAFYINNLYSIRNQVGNAGIIFFSYNDFFTENPLGKTAKNNPYVCFSGIVSYNSQRLGFNMLKSRFNNEETPVVNPGQLETEFPLVYIFAGAFAFLLWGAMINQSRRFREHTFRSLFRTYNFFADIRDRRLISNLQTGIFGFVLSIIIAIYFSSLMDFYKTNETFNCIINLLIPIDFIKEILLKFAWQPVVFVVVFSILIFLKLIILALILKFASLFVRSKIFVSDTFKMVIWAGAPLIAFLPVAIFANRIFPISPILGYIFNATFAVILIFWLLRLIKSIWIVFDVKPSKVYLISILTIFFIVFFYFSYLEYKTYFFDYVSHYLGLIY